MRSKQNKQLIPLARQLRSDMTKEERHLWYDFLRHHPVRFSRQKILGHYIVDFYSAEAKLVIELDGSQHYQTQNLVKDAARTAFLEGYGLRVVRIPTTRSTEIFPASAPTSTPSSQKAPLKIASPAQGEDSLGYAETGGVDAAVP